MTLKEITRLIKKYTEEFDGETTFVEFLWEEVIKTKSYDLAHYVYHNIGYTKLVEWPIITYLAVLAVRSEDEVDRINFRHLVRQLMDDDSINIKLADEVGADSEKNTLLHYLAESEECKSTAEHLIFHHLNEININAINANNKTPLDIAIEHKNHGLVIVLGMNGAKTHEELKQK